MIGVAYQRLERGGDAIGGGIAGDDLPRHESRDGAVGHPAHDRLHDLRTLVVGTVTEQAEQHVG